MLCVHVTIVIVRMFIQVIKHYG